MRFPSPQAPFAALLAAVLLAPAGAPRAEAWYQGRSAPAEAPDPELPTDQSVALSREEMQVFLDRPRVFFNNIGSIVQDFVMVREFAPEIFGGYHALDLDALRSDPEAFRLFLGAVLADEQLYSQYAEWPVAKLCFDGSVSRPVLERDVRLVDLLWFAKMVHGETAGSAEGGEDDAMYWAIAARSYGAAYWNKFPLAKLIQNYSQPVNEKWARDGIKCRAEVQKPNAQRIRGCQEHRLRNRDEYRPMAWTEVAEPIRERTLRWAAGEVPNRVVGAMAWLEEGTYGSGEKPGKHRVAHLDDNVFYGRTRNPDTRSWSSDTVTIRSVGASCR